MHWEAITGSISLPIMKNRDHEMLWLGVAPEMWVFCRSERKAYLRQTRGSLGRTMRQILYFREYISAHLSGRTITACEREYGR